MSHPVALRMQRLVGNRAMGSILQAAVQRQSHPGGPQSRPELERAFVSDIRTVAQGYLAANRRFAEQQAATLNQPDQSGALGGLRVAASGLNTLRWAQQQAREAYVGYERTIRGQGDFGYFWHWRRAHFDPADPPQFTSVQHDPDANAEYIYDELRAEDRTITADLDIAAVAPVRADPPLRRSFAEAETAASALLTAFPTLHAVEIAGPDQLTSFGNAPDSAAAKSVLDASLRRLLATISRTDVMLADGSLDPRDLGPIHEQLFSRQVAAPSGTDWSSGTARTTAAALVSAHHTSRALPTLGLAYVAHLAFLVAPLAGRAGGLAAEAIGTAALGTNAAFDRQRYSALATAAGASAVPGTGLVARPAVDDVRAASEAETIAFGLAALALGATAAAAGVDRFRQRRAALAERERQQRPPLPPAPSAPATVRRRLTPQEIRALYERRARVVVFRTHDQNLAANGELRFTGQTNPYAEEAVHFFETLEGQNYGPYCVCFELDDAVGSIGLRPKQGAAGEWVTPNVVPASAGSWYTVDDLVAAGVPLRHGR
ncbi:hypothetical protein [Nocardia asiatica]|uniref:hypothetical protein n=1 Tax=Nocardia asiatica TaxID=209252 RepID=UPI003EDF692B